jgi:type II secretory ATPase GspE/PulE/Tfp pilus assembly ATPase PilB-like protein
MGIEQYLIASTVIGFLSQRLVRVLCQQCKVPQKIDKEILRSEGLDPRQFEGKTIYAPAGCPKCQNTGFFDRMGIFEMIKVDDRVRKMIIEKRDAPFIREKCVASGMKTMLDDGIEKIIQGITSLDEVFRVIRD